jgi:heme exporter protein C
MKMNMSVKYLTGILFVIVIVFSIAPKISGSLKDADFFSSIDSTKVIPVDGIINKSSNGGYYEFHDKLANTGRVSAIPDEFINRPGIFYIHSNLLKKVYEIKKYESNNFFITFPFIPGLEEKARIILFHVPVAWISVLGFLVSMFYGIKYLRSNKPEYDNKSLNAASLGFLFCILATITGSIWAKFSWGSFWNWDPRETSIFILLLIYTSYFALRSAVEIEEKRAKLSSVYSIIAFITVPFFIFILPRITSGLHPGSADDISSPAGGPIIKSGLSGEMKIVFYISLLAFTLLFYWLFEIKNRISKLQMTKL